MSSFDEEFGLDEFSYHEVVDRIHCVEVIIENLLAGHPALVAQKDVLEKVRKAYVLIGEAYSLAANRHINS